MNKESVEIINRLRVILQDSWINELPDNEKIAINFNKSELKLILNCMSKEESKPVRVDQYLFAVPRECFEPQPKVTSAVLRAVVRREPPVEVEDEKFFFRVVYAAFALRRKTLVNSLMTAFGSQLTKEQVTQAVTSCGLEANIRGERLGLSEFAALSAEIAALL